MDISKRLKEGEQMKIFKILAENKKHYKSLIKDYRQTMNIITYTPIITELETIDGAEFVAIYNRDKMSGVDIERIFG